MKTGWIFHPLLTCIFVTVIYKTRVKILCFKTFTLHYHRRILFTDFSSQSLLSKEQYKYSYGRAFLMGRIKDTIIKLPIVRNADKTPVIDKSKRYSAKGYLPDWIWMEKYIKSLPYGDR